MARCTPSSIWYLSMDYTMTPEHIQYLKDHIGEWEYRDAATCLGEIERLVKLLAHRDRQMKHSTAFWVRAGKAALSGKPQELANRISLYEAPLVEVVLSAESPQCWGCPPTDYPTDETRCTECPLRMRP